MGRAEGGGREEGEEKEEGRPAFPSDTVKLLLIHFNIVFFRLSLNGPTLLVRRGESALSSRAGGREPRGRHVAEIRSRLNVTGRWVKLPRSSRCW